MTRRIAAGSVTNPTHTDTSRRAGAQAPRGLGQLPDETERWVKRWPRDALLHDGRGALGLGVGPEDVPNADAGWAVAERGVGAALVVVVDPVWQRLPTGLA
jgi:hypothetical protein